MSLSDHSAYLPLFLLVLPYFQPIDFDSAEPEQSRGLPIVPSFRLVVYAQPCLAIFIVQAHCPHGRHQLSLNASV